jgi:phospholipase C
VTSASRPDGPWTYTVEAGKQLAGNWRLTGAHDFAVHGPNGFCRLFRGRTGAGPELTARHDGASGTVRLTLANHGSTTVRLVVTDGYGHEQPAGYRLRPGGQARHTAHPARSNGWYDLAVTCDQDPGFLRKLAGHVETGRASTSDPALGTG